VSFDAHRTADELESSLARVGTPERAAGEKRYLKSDLVHLGTTVPDNRAIMRAFAREHRDLGHDQLYALIGALWSRRIFDCRFACGLLLEDYPELVTPADLDILQGLIRDSHTWALVDLLAADVIGKLLLRHPDAAGELDPWAADDDFWVRRSALLAQLRPLKEGASFDRFARYADAMLDEREFFIRKAIGWVLRDTAKRDPDVVYDWLAPRIARASGVTVREAVKYLDPQRRDELLAAHRARDRGH
jgi:3-methyladenine DNA glycosylase AlkD